MPVGDTIRLAVVEETLAVRDVILRIVSKRTEGGLGFVTYELEQPADSAVGDAVKAQALVETGDGLFRPQQEQVLSLGETVEGEVSTSLDGSASTFTFALEVGATSDTLIGQPSGPDRIEVTVSRSVGNLPEVPVPSPPEPVDEETATAFELPFTPFNDSPLFSGFENPVIDVPQKGDIQDVIGAQGLSERGFVDVLQGAEDAAEATEDTLTETVEPALDAIQPTVNSIETAVNGIPEDIATTGDLAFSSLQDDVAQLQTDIESLSLDVPEPDFPEVPTVEDITGAIEDELVPTVEGVSLLDDPIGFFDVAVEGVLEDLLSNDTQRDILRASRRRR